MKSKHPIALLLGCFALALGSAPAVSAADDNRPAAAGLVLGQVSNQATGDLLPGAVVQVEGTNISTVTERGGVYNLSLPPGTYTLLVSFAGLDQARTPVAVAAGAPVTRDVTLTSTIYKLDAFTVAGVREGNALAIQTQRLAENPKWVVATDTYGNPAVNPGELIQRMPGISADITGGQIRTLYLRGMGTGFSSLLVDGDRMAASNGNSASRDFQIEQLGTGNLETVELIKAPQPEQDANAVAGFVNLVSRRAFDASGRKIGFTVGTMWRLRPDMSDGTPFKDKPGIDLLNVNYSDVFDVLGKQKNLGVAFNFSRRVSSTAVDEEGPNFIYSISQAYLNATTATPLTRAWGTGDFGQNPASVAYNSGLSVDYRLSSDAFVFAKFAYNDHYQPQKGLRAVVGNPAATAANFTPDSTFQHSFLLPHAASIGNVRAWPEFTKHARNYAVNGGVEFKVFERSVTVSLRGNYSHADISYPGTLVWNGVTTGTTGIGFEIDRRGQDEWYPLIRQTAGPSIYDPASYNMSTLTRQTNRAPNDVIGYRTDVTKRFDGLVPASIKAGVKYASDDRTARTDFTAWTFAGRDGILNSADDGITPYVDVHYKQGANHYGPWPFVTKPLAVPEGYWRQTAADVYNSIATTKSGDVKFREQITAGYVQGSLQLGRLRVLGGIRVEETETKGTAWVRNTTASWAGNSVGGTSLDPATVAANAARAERSFVRRNTGTGKYRDVFPGLHFVYRVTDGLLARASYNRAISRPAVASLLPTITENLDALTISMGNPNLKPFHTNNFDVSIEKYFEPVGLFSVGAFLKEISDYSRTISSVVGPDGVDGSGTYAGYQLSTTQNVGSARVRGMEASYQQQLSFLPGALKGLGVFANFTSLQTEGNFGGLSTTRRLANLTPRSGNTGINYRYRGLDARLLLNWTGERFRGTNGGVDTYSADRRLLDLKLQYTINRRYDVFLDMSNLTNEPVGTVIALNGLRQFKENGGVFFSAGVRGRF
ncbi:MAG: TonB-dependent receptor [Verrucomicrobia bacterium]|nr:TonB-dependent receptor [Verrucomicrobiota bacterium]